MSNDMWPKIIGLLTVWVILFIYLYRPENES